MRMIPARYSATMARRASSDYGASDLTMYGDHGYGGDGGNYDGQEPEPEEPIPGWRKPIALVGWGILIAILIGLIIWGIIQLVRAPHRRNRQPPR